MVRPSGLIAICGLVACFGPGGLDRSAGVKASFPHVTRRPDRVRTICRLKAKPGNAFTYVPPPPSNPSTLSGGATINVTFDSSFNLTPAAKTAFQFAVGIWAAQISSPVPIEVYADYVPLDPGELGHAGANINLEAPGTIPRVLYGDPLADRLSGANQEVGQADIVASFSSETNWYFGTDGATPAGKYDFVSVVLHELTHGLGFAGSAYVTDNGGGTVGGVALGGFPDAFDLFAVTETGQTLLGIPNETAQLAVPLLSPYNAGNPHGPGTYWGGASGKAANGGVTPRLYTPSLWLDGSSYSHLDEDVFPAGNPNSLMTFQLSAAEAIHSPGPIVLGIFDDLGWNGHAELITNGNFSGGMTNWELFEIPDIVNNSASNGTFQFYKANPTTSPSGQAVILQHTGVPMASGDQLVASFKVGNSSTVRKRISVLIHDQDFSDLSVCTFWVPAFAPLIEYQMQTHTTKAWTGATISFYAASSGSSGGNYLLDDVSLKRAPTALAAETRCFDPWFPFVDGSGDGAELLSNADFSGGSISPWQTFGTLTSNVTAGVFRFTRDNGTPPAGVVLQPSAHAIPTSSIVTASFDLGNSSGVRKRVTVLLHDLSFGDLTACTFWLPPGQALSHYVMRSYVTAPWSNATLSVYAATVGTDQWTLLDNASLKVTGSTQTLGTECGEPGGAVVAGRAVIFGGTNTGPNPGLITKSPTQKPGKPGAVPRSPGHGGTSPSPAVPAPTRGRQPASPTPVGQPFVLPAVLAISSHAPSGASVVAVQVSDDGKTWRTIAVMPVSGKDVTVYLDANVYSQSLHLRFVYDDE